MTDPTSPSEPTRRARVVGAQILVCLVAVLLLHRGEVGRLLAGALGDPEAAHLLLLPILAVLLAWRRREVFERTIERGSIPGFVLGVALVVLSIGIHAAASWPYDYLQVRLLAIVPLATGIVLALAGWRATWHAGPILVLLALAIGLGSRYQIVLTSPVASTTIDVTAAVVDRLPGVTATVDRDDITFVKDGRTALVAPGDTDRGAALLFTMASLGIFVIFARVRDWWRSAIAIVLLGPIVLLANGLRLLVTGAWTVLLEPGALARAPRIAGAALGLLAAYGGVVLVLALIDAVVPPLPADEDGDAEAGSKEMTDAVRT